MSDPFADYLPTPSQGTLTPDGESHAKLKRNLATALDIHDKAMNFDFPPEVEMGEKRLAVEAATVTLKAALTTDRTALKARSDNVLERVLLRVIFYRRQMGKDVNAKDLEKLKTAPRADLEAALGNKIGEYDRMEW